MHKLSKICTRKVLVPLYFQGMKQENVYEGHFNVSLSLSLSLSLYWASDVYEIKNNKPWWAQLGIALAWKFKFKPESNSRKKWWKRSHWQWKREKIETWRENSEKQFKCVSQSFLSKVCMVCIWKRLEKNVIHEKSKDCLRKFDHKKSRDKFYWEWKESGRKAYETFLGTFFLSKKLDTKSRLIFAVFIQLKWLDLLSFLIFSRQTMQDEMN